MKIQLGIGSKKDLLEFINKGVDEFYIGIENIPGHLYGSNHIANLREVLEIIDIVHSNKKKLFVVANEVRGDLFNKTIKTIDELVHNQIDGIIIRDIAVLETLKKKNIKIYLILSSLALCFNKDCLKFYKGLGINRIALPEHITYEEAKPLINNGLDIDTEMFITAREFCLVLNGFCYLHLSEGECTVRKAFLTQNNKIFTMPGFSINQHFKNLYNFHKYGCNIIKMGRAPIDFSKTLLNETKLIKNLLEMRLSEEKFISNAINIHMKFTKLLGLWKKKLKKQ